MKYNIYVKSLKNISGLSCLANSSKKINPVIWLTTIICDRKDFLQKN